MVTAQVRTQEVITGNQAAAWGAFLARNQVVAAYPITPQTTIIETMAELTSKAPGRCRFITVESEHSALAACIGAATAGARVFTATSSQGLLLMHELLHWAAGGRTPMVMVDVNRAPAPGWNIWSDQNDSLSQRDTGWIQLYCQNSQEVLDTVIQATKLSEELLVPVMVVLDAFVLSHTAEAVEIPEQGLVDSFLPERFAPYAVDVNNPSAFGGLLIADYYQDVRKKLHDAQKAAFPLMERIEDEWEKLTGRHYGAIDEYRCEDADIILMTMATASSTSRVVVDSLRSHGLRVGRLGVKMFRPFPAEKLRTRLRNRQKVVILDRNCSYGSDGILFTETKSALYALPEAERPQVYGYISGLGGRDLTPALIASTVTLSMDGDPDAHSTWIK
jgi:pyruvate/2-oxoacid:ferredoxin oxidoreductase alpha subunit